MHVPHNAHVLVADGAKMLFFRNEGDADHLNLQVVEAAQQADPADRDIKTDTAGQSPGHGTMGEADFHQQNEDRFAADAADLLNKKALAGAYEQLIIVAPAKTLGVLRKHLHGEAEKRVIGELSKDLTGQPVDGIEKHLAAA